jgi:hypothetical protein
MLRPDDVERRKNPNRDAMLDWRKALEREWDADRRRRESHQSDATLNLESGGTSGVGDGRAPLPKT